MTLTKPSSLPAPPRLSIARRLAYGVGHVQNDLCASIWFSYTLVFLQHVMGLSTNNAGLVLLVGQFVDGIATPIIGYESDKTRGCAKYGRRKSWHLAGTICVAVSFPFIYMQCPGCDGQTTEWAKLLYYCPVVFIFQVGWAAVQISHMALIPDLTHSENDKTELTTIRYAWSVISNITVYITTWILLGTVSDDSHFCVTGKDAHVFFKLVLIVSVIGVTFSVLFHAGTRERRFLHYEDHSPVTSQDDVSTDANSVTSPSTLVRRSLEVVEHDDLEEGESEYRRENNVDIAVVSRRVNHMSWLDWLREKQFYQVAVIYMCTRLSVNVSQVYMPLYVTQSLRLRKEYIAAVPLLMYTSGFCLTLLLKWISAKVGRKMTYGLGGVCLLCSCVLLRLHQYLSLHVERSILLAAGLLGAGATTITVSVISMTADLIGQHTESGAFVFGAMSLADKFANGLAIIAIQRLYPCPTNECCEACVTYYRDVMVYAPIVFTCLSLLVLTTLLPVTIGRLHRDKVMHEESHSPLLELEANR